MSKELIARVAGDAIRSGPNGPAAAAFRRAIAMAEIAIRVLETDGAGEGKARLIDAIQCYLEAHSCRVSREQIRQELDDELARSASGRALTRAGRPPHG